MQANPTSDAPLKALLAHIEQSGPMWLPTYIKFCLADPQFGYYTANPGIGEEGDFITAPEITPLFGETIAVWVYLTWQKLGKPDPFCLCEFGPGRGLMFSDVMNALQKIDMKMSRSALPILIETSPTLIRKQQQQLRDIHHVKWLSHGSMLPEMPTIVLANELLDVLPIVQWVRKGNRWYQRFITANQEKTSIVPVWIPLQSCSRKIARHGIRDATAGAIVESSPWRVRWINSTLRRLSRTGGGMLAIDYGYGMQVSNALHEIYTGHKKHQAVEYGDSIQAIYRHQKVSPWLYPGLSDITSHVDFNQLTSAAIKFPAADVQLAPMSDFLAQHGFHARHALWMARASESQKPILTKQLERLTHKEQMGNLFKVLDVRIPC